MQKILLVDDDPDVIAVLQMLLKKKGYQVATASREEEAYKQVELFKPHLIVLDVLLSGVDGRAICKKNKKHRVISTYSHHNVFCPPRCSKESGKNWGG